MNHACTPSEDWTQRYETVRQHALVGTPVLPMSPLGMVLLVRHGVAQWMRLWLSPTDEPSKSTKPTSTLGLTGGWQDDLTRLLAQITLQHLQTNSCL